MNSITGEEIIHIFEHSKLSSDCFTEDAVSAAYVNALAALYEKLEREKFVNAEHCVCCGATIPEGRQICVNCEAKANEAR